MESRGFDIARWSDSNYAATIAKYNLQDLEKAKHLCPKLYFEPRGSSEEEEFRDMLLEREAPGTHMPTTEEPFCVQCEAMLGANAAELGITDTPSDPRCHTCGFLNPHGQDGKLMTAAQVDLVEFEPAPVWDDLQQAEAEKYLSASNMDDLHLGQANIRPTTQQTCEECGWKKAYYWSAQVLPDARVVVRCACWWCAGRQAHSW